MNRYDVKTDELIQLASTLQHDERLVCETDLTENIQLLLKLSNRPYEDASMRLQWHTRDNKIMYNTPLMGSGDQLQIDLDALLSEYRVTFWHVMVQRPSLRQADNKLTGI